MPKQKLPLQAMARKYGDPPLRCWAAVLALLATAAVLCLDTAWLVTNRTHSVHQPTGRAAGTGVSGTIFRGDSVNSFSGPLLFAGTQQLTKQLAVSSAAAAAWPAKGHSSSNWAVCTTIFSPSEAIMGVAALPGWMVVVVGDTSSVPFNFTAPNLVYLSAKDQQDFLKPMRQLGNLLPWKHFGRKNVGYLYAISHGAEVIWDFDDDNVLKAYATPAMPPADSIRTLQLTTAAAATACEAYNVYTDFLPSAERAGLPSSWPRGFPLDLISKPCNYSLVPGKAASIAVVQSLADNDPDVDGIFRLTRGVPFNFDRGVRHTIAVPQGTLTPWNAQATLFFKPALWSLLLPVTVHGRVSDIWRSYVSQRLLWDVGYLVAFAPPMVDQFRSPHNYLGDMQAELDLYYKSGQLVKFLRAWKGTSNNLAGRYEELMVALFERGYIGEQDVLLTQQWLLALHASGYAFPAVTASSVLSTPTTSRPEDAQPSADASPPRSLARAANVIGIAQSPGHASSHTNGAPSAWAVFSTSEGVTPIMQQVAAMDGWRVVVVAESPAVPSSVWPNITFLTLQQQDSLGYAILQHLPHEGPWRKNVGYMYAIHNGAFAVYDADADSLLLDDHIPMLSCSAVAHDLAHNLTTAPCFGTFSVLDKMGHGNQSGASSTSRPAVLNPYLLFGQSKLWPRGMPTETSLSGGSFCFSRQAAQPLIQQAMTNGQPDAGFQPYLQDIHAGSVPQRPDVKLDATAFPVVLPEGVMAPLNRHNTLFLHDALWTLLLPITGDSLADTARGYLAQRMMWEIGANAAILPATAARNKTYSGSAMIQQTWVDLFVQDLWDVKLTSDSFLDKLLELHRHMMTRGHLQGLDMRLLEAWLTDIQHAGLTPPSLATRPPQPAAKLPGEAPQMSVTNRNRQPDPGAGNGSRSVDRDAARQLYTAITNGTRTHSFAFPARWCMHMDKVLYINLNRIGGYSMQEQARLLHAVYRPFFRQVVFAGFGSSDPLKVGSPGVFYGCDEYVTHRKQRPAGFFAQTCLAGFLASDMWQSLTQGESVGLLYINDDVVFDPCAVVTLDPKKVWYGSSERPDWQHAIVPVSNLSSWHWPRVYGPGNTTLKEATAQALKSAYGPLAQRVQQRLQGGSHVFNGGQADVFYVPAHLHRMFSDAAHQFHAHYLISEVAVINILGLIHDEGGVEEVLVVMAWGDRVRGGIVKTILEDLPAADMLSCELLQTHITAARGACTGKAMFALHPYKLSNTAAAVHWLAWWLAQDC